MILNDWFKKYIKTRIILKIFNNLNIENSKYNKTLSTIKSLINQKTLKSLDMF